MNPKTPQKRLGRGLSSLISGDLAHPAAEMRGHIPAPAPAEPRTSADANLGRPDRPSLISARESTGSPHGAARLASLPIEAIRTNPLQPRKVFDDARLAELAESIRSRGTLQPIVVRPADGGYELVAGERRLRASKLAGLTDIPALIRAVADEHLLELALIENVQRADLNPIERAQAYRLLIDKYKLTHDDVARRTGEDRATVSNILRILSLGDFERGAVADGTLSLGHAKALLAIEDAALRERTARQAIAEGWSVRRLEQLGGGGRKAEPAAKEKRPVVANLEERLRAALGVRVSIHESRRRHAGKIVIEYGDLKEFERIVRQIGVEPESD